MKYTFTKLNDKFPKKANRSDRTLKKLHLGSYAETCVDVSLDYPVELYNDEFFDGFYDALYQVLPDFGTFGIYDNKFTFIYTVPSASYNEEDVKTVVNEVLRLISNVDQYFADIKDVSIVYADAWYGEW